MTNLARKEKKIFLINVSQQKFCVIYIRTNCKSNLFYLKTKQKATM